MHTPLIIHVLFVSTILLPYKIRHCKAEYIFVYSDHYQQGSKLNISIAKCSDFPEEMAGQVTSINTRDNCARFYDRKNCSGSSIEVLAASPAHHNLHFWEFNDRAMSVGPCQDPCHVEITGTTPEEPLKAKVFTRPDFKGAYADIIIEGCTLIPTNFIHRTLSVKTNGHCLQLYNNVNCKTKGADVRSIELRPGTPYHDDISKWWLPETKAISHCSHKCSRQVEVSKDQISPGPGEVIIFAENNFEGNWLKIKLENNRCVNITNEWEGVAMSVKVGKNTCTVLYDQRDCTATGVSIIVNSAQPDLSERKFDSVTRSLQPCGQWAADKSQQQRDIGSKVKVNGSRSEGKSNNADYYSFSPEILAALIICPLIGIAVSVFLVLFIMRRCHPYKNIMEMLSEKEIQEFLSGLGMDMDTSGEAGGNDGDYSVELLAQNKPYNESYEISRSQIKYDTKQPLGMGEFGVVYKGTVTVNEENQQGSSSLKPIPVAVKTVRPGTGAQCLRSLLKEVKVMLYVGKHPHIAYMVGCCTENLRKGEILVLMEFCKNGSMESFLQKHRQSFKNIVKKGRIEPQNNEDYSNFWNYQNMEDVDGFSRRFNFFQLLEWCIEVARGMEFLELSKVVHSDLAARNVLLADNFQAKISDFGLSRQLYCYTEYVKKHQEPLPWRWLAIESLKQLEFSTKSDIWSYGVLCWEIFTLGEKPYPGVVWSDIFIANLEDGLRLGKPKYATTECYNILIRCWNEEPQLRPSFSEIIEDLQDAKVSTDNPKISYTELH